MTCCVARAAAVILSDARVDEAFYTARARGSPRFIDTARAYSIVNEWRRTHGLDTQGGGGRVPKAEAEWDAARLPSLRPNQVPVLESCFRDATSLRSGVVVAPCGFGKSVVAMHALRRRRGTAIVVSPTHMLLQQWRAHFAAAGISTLLFGQERLPPWDTPWPTVLLCTYTALVAQTRDDDDRPGTRDLLHVRARLWSVLVLDEVHKVPAPVYAGAIGTLLVGAKIGLTGTLTREDGAIGRLDSLVGPVLHRSTVSQLVEEGYAPKLDARIVHVPFHPLFAEAYAEASGHRRLLLSILNPCKLAALVELLNRRPLRKTIVFCDRLAAIQPIFACLRLLTKDVHGPLTGSTSYEERQAYLHRFREAPAGTLLISDVGSHGIDVPDLDCEIELSANSSRSQYGQRQGRIQRFHRHKHTVESITLVTQHTSEAAVTEHRTSECDAPLSVERRTLGGAANVVTLLQAETLLRYVLTTTTTAPAPPARRSKAPPTGNRLVQRIRGQVRRQIRHAAANRRL